MLPEPTAGKSAAPPARPQPGVMTPLFAVPGGPEPDATPATGRRVRPAARTRQPRRASPRLPAADSGPRKDTADLLTVTAERLRRALGRSFLRYGIASDLEAAVHAAMNVIEPVLDARDTEILRLRRLMAGKAPGKSAR
jgi:hypothetical protein